MEVIQIIINAVFALAVIWGGVILYKQNKSQTQIITALEKYSNIIDIDKLIKYDKYREDSIMLKAESEIKSKTEANDDVYKVYQQAMEEGIMPQFQEFLGFAAKILIDINETDREKIYKSMFPKGTETIKRLVDGLDEYNKTKSLNY